MSTARLGTGSKAVLAVLILGVAFLWLEMLRLSDNYLSANASATFEDVLGGFALALMVTILATLGAVAVFGGGAMKGKWKEGDPVQVAFCDPPRGARLVPESFERPANSRPFNSWRQFEGIHRDKKTLASILGARIPVYVLGTDGWTRADAVGAFADRYTARKAEISAVVVELSGGSRITVRELDSLLEVVVDE